MKLIFQYYKEGWGVDEVLEKHLKHLKEYADEIPKYHLPERIMSCLCAQMQYWEKEDRGCEMKDKIESVLNKIKSYLQAEGGDVELVEVTSDGVVKVKLTGACGTCPMRQMTLKIGIERALKQEVPEVKEVIAV